MNVFQDDANVVVSAVLDADVEAGVVAVRGEVDRVDGDERLRAVTGTRLPCAVPPSGSGVREPERDRGGRAAGAGRHVADVLAERGPPPRDEPLGGRDVGRGELPPATSAQVGAAAES